MARIHAEVAIALISMSRLARMGTTMNGYLRGACPRALRWSKMDREEQHGVHLISCRVHE